MLNPSSCLVHPPKKKDMNHHNTKPYGLTWKICASQIRTLRPWIEVNESKKTTTFPSFELDDLKKTQKKKNVQTSTLKTKWTISWIKFVGTPEQKKTHLTTKPSIRLKISIKSWVSIQIG